MLQVGTTLTINLTLAVGGIEESVTVTGQSPLVDTTSATVGGNVGTAELSELPAMNRNYFSAVALLPGRAVLALEPDGQRHHRGQRPDLAEHQRVGRRRLQRRRCARHELGRAGADAARGGAGIPGPDQHVRRGVRPRQRRDRQRGEQVRHQPVQGRAVRLRRRQRADGRGLFRRAQQPRQSRPPPSASGAAWLAGRSSRTSCTSSAASSARSTTRTARACSKRGRTRTSAIAEDRTDWNTLLRVDHQINQSHTWAVRWLREWAPQWNTIGNRQTLGIVAGRNRPRSDRGRHADQRDRQLARQHRAHRADVGALVARQRLLPRAGPESATAPVSSSARRPTGSSRCARRS